MRLAWSAVAFLATCSSGVSGSSMEKRGGYCMGDPHCVTFDGFHYDCQLGGVFIFVSAPDTETTVQVAFELVDGAGFSVVTAVKAHEGVSPSIDVTSGPGSIPVIELDGLVYDGGSASWAGVELGVTDSRVVMKFDSGLEVVVETGDCGSMALWAFAPPTMNTIGLLGNNNGDPFDDDGVSDYCAYNILASTGDVPADVAEVCGDNAQCIFDATNVDLEAGQQLMTCLQEFDNFEPDCPPDVDICDDPHMRGLQGQKIEVSGVDGGWYCLVTDAKINLHVNVRFTAPLPEEFPDRQLITGLAVLSEGHSLVVEVKDPYSVHTTGCPSGISPCLADGGLRIVVDGEEVNGLLAATRDEFVADGMTISASNLPVECRQFGGGDIWASMYAEMMQGSRKLVVESFEDSVVRFNTMAAPDWCGRYIAERGLADVQSSYALLKISTPSVDVRLHTGVNHQGGDGELSWDGRVLPELKFWQMNTGLEGLDLEHKTLSGLLGETARLVYKGGRPVMSGDDAFRGTVEDYRVSGAVGTDFAFLRNNVP